MHSSILLSSPPLVEEKCFHSAYACNPNQTRSYNYISIPCNITINPAKMMSWPYGHFAVGIMSGHMPMDLPQLLHILFRGRRQGRQPLNPGDRLCPIHAHIRSTILVVIYSVFCVWCKKIVFYGVLWPSPSPGFISATLKNYGFFMVLGLRKGSGTENWTS